MEPISTSGKYQTLWQFSIARLSEGVVGKMEIKVRNSIRVLGLFLSLLGFFVIWLMILEEESLSRYEFFYSIFAGLFFFPLVLSSSILGRVPYFISKRIPKFLKIRHCMQKRILRSFQSNLWLERLFF